MSLERFEDLERNLQDVINFYKTELQEIREVIEGIKKVDEIETNGDINLFIAKNYIQYGTQSVVYKILRENNYKFKYTDRMGNKKSRLYTKDDISNTLFSFIENTQYPEGLRNIVDKLLFYNSAGKRTRRGDFKVPKHRLLKEKKQSYYD
ncbi:hypothetical protein [Clostridium perfringens]|uniref:hypothetical protein n=1 Tax=Clostridium perfringens TaxID=1502 RepID=UPI0024BC1FCC|nr:hypothetical protein [Clostridium perfringens]